MKLCDLHTHSYFSDGTYSPTEIVREAEKIGLSAVALCDHLLDDGTVIQPDLRRFGYISDSTDILRNQKIIVVIRILSHNHAPLFQI